MLASHERTAIADGGSNEILFPSVYTGLTNHSLSSTTALMADGVSTLALYGTALYGIFPVCLADVPRPIWSESILTLPPYNLHIYKKGRQMIVYEQPSLITVCTATVSTNGLYYIDDITTLLHFRPSSVVVSVLDLTPSPPSVIDCTVLSPPPFVGGVPSVAGPLRVAGVLSVAGVHVVTGIPSASASSVDINSRSNVIKRLDASTVALSVRTPTSPAAASPIVTAAASQAVRGAMFGVLSHLTYLFGVLRHFSGLERQTPCCIPDLLCQVPVTEQQQQ